MHSALLLEEFVRAIYQQMEPQDAVSLSLTCRVVSDFVLNALWENPISLVPLICVFPSKFIQAQPIRRSVAGTIAYSFVSDSFDSELEDSQWARVQSYASRIKRFDNLREHAIGGVLKGLVYPNVFKALSEKGLSEAKPLFPNLNSMSWFPGIYDIGFLRALTSPSLKHLRFIDFPCRGLYEAEDDFDTDLQELWAGNLTILEDISTRCPNLQTLVLPSTSWKNRTGQRLAKGMRNTILSWKHLRHLDFDHTDDLVLQHVSTLPKLRTLAIALSNDGYLVQDTFGVSTFQSLNRLILREAVGFEPCAKFLEALSRAPGLSCLELHSVAPGSISDLLNVVNQRCSPDLKELSVYENCGHPRDSSPTSFLTAEDLRPAYSFHSLEKFTINTRRSGKLSDGDLLELAQAWPRLVSLNLNVHSEYQNTSCLSLGGLAVALQHWPYLEELGVSVDATAPSIDYFCANWPDGMPQVPTLRKLDLGASQIDDNTQEVAQCLRHFIGGLERANLQAWSEKGRDPSDKGYSWSWKRWQDVFDTITNYPARMHGRDH
ncbi:hypothetical protein CONPUDRAFT_70384 [Coniophora puteana RWD-64-598 SS2]|uniref:F-box domain-containing protein n=1 Tax=Coniophora puteana (strain RWD-64-598) TaxID=741705 RepID=A0A5M3N2L5_CONPW|nr:uncharacterized protein CONPUDRAFT_70384 [Coniophora puteana RWD-64-598 SS2]EIW85623.1 hypothetical protein CONPUDRAFT_70384 [Coniophora puteana RWD-64-598 SS2]